MHAIQEPLPLLEPVREPSVDGETRLGEPLAGALDEVTAPGVDDDSLLRLAALSRGELRSLFR